jgi:hypothetical protein
MEPREKESGGQCHFLNLVPCSRKLTASHTHTHTHIEGKICSTWPIFCPYMEESLEKLQHASHAHSMYHMQPPILTLHTRSMYMHLFSKKWKYNIHYSMIWLKESHFQHSSLTLFPCTSSLHFRNSNLALGSALVKISVIC